MPKDGRRATVGVMDFLRYVLPKDVLIGLYEEEKRGRFVCRAVLQQLSLVTQQVVVRLACCAGEFPAVGVQVWTALKPKQQDTIFLELYEWGILSEQLVSSDLEGKLMRMTPQFLKGLQESMRCLSTAPWNSLQPIQLKALEEEAAESHKSVTMEDLERYTQHVWDDVLHFLVGSTGREEPPAAVVHFLLQTGLMQPDPDFNGPEDDAPLVITQTGYDFMLQDNHQQVWHFLVQYLKSLQKQDNGQNLVREALLLLICLSFARVGEPYLASALNKDSRTMVKHLALFGLLYTRKIGKATVFYPTRIALQIVDNDETDSASSSLFSLSTKALDAALADPRPKESSHLAIIVQTNFQVCAYTTSPLHLAMLGLFCDVGTIRRLPNIVIMHMTRDSVTSAFNLGIQARQILRFLEKHSHPNLRSASNVVNVGSAFSSPIPANVVDQIWLWDRERSRVRLTEVYQHQCLMEGEFSAVVQFSQSKGAHAWSSEKRSLIFVDYAQAEKVQKFARQWRTRASSNR
ncbi:transcription initiation factor TFIIH subunit 4 [Fistulifera solaris]|uniref:General transcription factor IIH subunit 4 n=1 Tax=Fistulifera solaris TaxID=1519565 RepID=A0A1Z5KA95_FISSO|nr:transcription initiation factor TFIIH subunit 4 [Fistulifera solaris]|eukprot:GAX22858.1 transcription initiation factor TFIIH subunit 4 [Fistulifera solaris]